MVEMLKVVIKSCHAPSKMYINRELGQCSYFFLLTNGQDTNKIRPQMSTVLKLHNIHASKRPFLNVKRQFGQICRK